MKLHLPVQLFRAVIALMAVATPFSASARKYTVADGKQLTLSGLDELDLDISGYYQSSSSSRVYGGAIYATGTGAITIEHYVNLLFNKNYAASSSSYYYSYGGAIYSYSGAITLSGNESVTFSGNYASTTFSYAYGGAIYSSSGAITLSGNGSVTFSGNYAYSYSDYDAYSSYGGAIYSRGDTITLNGNKSVTFSGNYAGEGGAIYSNSCSIKLSGNESVTFSGNYAYSDYGDSYGGAIYSCYSGDITLSGNKSVTFSGNYAGEGGAIYSERGSITLSGNESVLFEKNYEKSGSSYRLRSIYLDGVVDSRFTLSAPEGGIIEFRDGIYVGGGVVSYNAPLIEADGVEHLQTGDILFTGAYTEAHLKEVKGGTAGTEAEISNSRLTQVWATTNLYGGRLRVEDGAYYRGVGLIAAENGHATVRVKNATMDHAGYDMVFHSGSSLELSGKTTLLGNLIMNSGSALSFGDKSDNVLEGNLTLGTGVSLVYTGDAGTAAENTVLLCVCGDIIGWDKENLLLNGGVQYTDLTWVNGDLLLNYNAATFNPYHHDYISYTQQVTTGLRLCHYNKIAFSNIGTSSSSSSTGGAIYSFSAITMSGNKSVTFSGNYAYSNKNHSYGGAIYSYSGDITLSGNESVTFSGNYATSDDSAAYGGAICSASAITLSGNESVTFSGNYASSDSSDYYSYGGAIYNYSGDAITLSGNESVLFEKNYEKRGSSYRLRSIYLSGDSNARFTLSAPEGGIIEFRDGIFVDGGVVSYNAPLIEADGAEHLQTGDILFTGAYTEAHLKEVKGGTAGTKAEISNSRLTQVWATTNLCGGRLRVEDGAYYRGVGLIAAENGHATVRVKNATMDHAGYDMVFHSGSSLELSGKTTLLGNLIMNRGSALSFGDKSDNVLEGNLTLGTGVSLVYTGDAGTAAENTVLLCVCGDITGWNKESLILNGSVKYADLTWVYGELLLNYNATTFNPCYYNGDISYTQRVKTGLTLHNYNNIEFSNIGTSSSSSAYGGAIYSSSGDITLSGNGSVTFSGNYSKSTASYGGAIYSDSGAITLSGNESVTFSGNYAESTSSYSYGGAIRSISGDITLSGNKSVTFSGNYAYSDSSSSRGGAIYSSSGDITLSGNESVLFEKNYEKSGSSYRLRSIYLDGVVDSRFTLSAPEGGIIEFRDGIYVSGGVVSYNAPLIEADGAECLQTGDILFTGAYTKAHLKEVKGGTAGTEAEISNSRLSQVMAITKLYGGRLRVEDGAYYRGYGLVAAENGHATVLVKNATMDHAGYDMVFHSGSSLELSGKTTLLGNLIMNSGSALSFGDKSDNVLEGNLTLGTGVSLVYTGDAGTAAENTVLLCVSGDIIGWDKENLLLNGGVQYSDLTWVNGDLLLNYNAATFNPYYHGDISYTQRVTTGLTLCHYNKIAFSNIGTSSSSAYGGAIYNSSGDITLSGNESVIFSGNYAYSSSSSSYSYGGAIYSSSGDITLSGNESVLFEKNYEKSGSSYRLRSIYLSGGSNSRFTLSAPEGGIIEFRDGIYIGGGVVSYNAPLIEADGVEHLQTGDILFTGAYTEAHLKEVKGGTAGTEAEISNSRLTQVWAITHLYGGRLRVEDGAYYQGKGLVAAENSHATVLVKNATMDHAGYDMVFHSGSSLVLEGSTTLMRNLTMNSGSSLSFDDSSYISVGGNLTLGDGVRFIYTGDAGTAAENTVLLCVSGDIIGWDKENLLLNGGVQYTDLTWVNGDLLLNYNAATFNPYHHGDISYTQRVTTGLRLRHYNKIAFSNINTSASGGAIYIESDAITMHRNGHVRFTGNYVSSSSNKVYGGAVYGAGSAAITLSGNGGVSFEKNYAKSSSYSTYGGGVYVTKALTIADNGEVTFSGNYASSAGASAYGGAVYVNGGDLQLHGNDKVRITKNYVTSAYESAEVLGGALYANNAAISLSENGSVVIDQNYGTASKYVKNYYAYAYGGALASSSSTLSLTHSDSVSISNNSIRSVSGDAQGGAIYGIATTLILQDNGTIAFAGNNAATTGTTSSVTAKGAALYVYNASVVDVTNNGNVSFTDNDISAVRAFGGAVYAGKSTDLVMSSNTGLSFAENRAVGSTYAYGGAVFSWSATDIVAENNGEIVFRDNTATADQAFGGAISADGGMLRLAGNKRVLVEGNAVQSHATSGIARGGAIYGEGGADISLYGNDSVVFTRNYEYTEETGYRLRSLYHEAQSGTELNLAAKAGGEIIFYDSVYMSQAEGATVCFNADTEDAQGVLHKGGGDIIFSGQYTEEHLNGIIAANTAAGELARAATDTEILHSKTSEINNLITLHGGSLQVLDGAVLAGHGIHVKDASGARIVLRDACLAHGAYGISLGKGTVLEVQGCSNIESGTLTLAEGATLRFTISEANADAAVLTLGDTQLSTGKFTLELNTESALDAGMYHVLRLGADAYAVAEAWTEKNVTITGAGYTQVVNFDDFHWSEGVLYYELFEMAWNNASSNALWNKDALNWSKGGNTIAYSDGVSVRFGDTGAGTITLQGELKPNKVTVNNSVGHDYRWIGDGALGGMLELKKQGSGTLSISTDNSYGGETIIEGGALVAAHRNALGNSVVRLDGGTLYIDTAGVSNLLEVTEQGGGVVVTDGYTYHVRETIANSGQLTLKGHYNLDSLALYGGVESEYRVNLDGNKGLSGFAMLDSATLDVVNGGTLSAEQAVLTYRGNEVVLNASGSATVYDVVDYSRYYIGSEHTASAKAITAKAASKGVELSGISLVAGGTLRADASAHVTATGGNIVLTGGTLSGALENVSLTASSGEIEAAFNGNNSLTGSNYALTTTLDNSGTLTLSGSFVADALSPQFIGDDVRVDVAGNEGGTSGFLRSSDFSVAIASGTLDSSNATVSYKGQALSMKDGVGYGIGTVDYSNYLLTDGNSASVSDILDAANGALEDITMTGGKLTVDDSVVLDATGGNINITADSTLSGSMVDADITTAEGEYENTISAGVGGDSSLTVNGGTITVTGDNTYTGGTIINGGMLNIGSDTSLGAGDVTLNEGTLDLGDFAVRNDILATGGTLSGADNYGGKLTVNGDVVLDGDIVAQGGIELNGGSISGGGIVDTDVTIHTEGYTDVDFDITGDSSLTINGGDVIITGGNNDYTGGTTLNGGSLTIGSTGTLGSGVVTLNGGVLNTNETELTNDIVNNGGTVVSNYVLDKGRTLTIGADGATFVGDIVLSGGLLYFEGMPLTVNGKVSGGDAPVSVHVTGYSVLDAADTVLLADFGDQVVGLGLNNFVNIGGGELIYDSASNTLHLKLADKNTWIGGRGAEWTAGGNVGWKDGDAFATGNRVVFNGKGTVKIVGGVEPASVLVDVEKSLTFSTTYNKKTGLYSGAIVGNGCVVKRGKGMLTLNDGNEYTGGTFIEAGTVKAKGATSFGIGAITLSGGAVDLASKAVANDIVLDGSAAVKGGKAYAGEFTMTGGDLLKGSLINVAEEATLKGGVVNGTLSGVGTVEVEGAVTLGASGKITTNALEIDGALSVSAKGLVMNSKASAITIEGGTLSSAGKISAYSMNMTGGTLDVTNAKPMGITLKDAFVATAGADIDLYGALTANQLTLEGVDFALAMDAADIAPKVQPKAQSITLKGKGVLNTVSDSELDIAGKVSVTGDLALQDSTISLHDVAGAAKPKAQGLTVKGELAVEDDSALVMTGTLSAGALSATDSTIAIAAEEGLVAQSLKLTRKDATKGVPQENILSDSAVYVNGSMSVAGNLQLQESYLALRDYSGKKKAMGLSVKGDLSLSSDSYLKLTGALSAKNLTLEGGSSLTLGSAKLSTVKVGGVLTLNGAVNFDLGFTVTEKDVAKGKEYTLFSFKSLVGDVSNLTLGYEGEYTLALNTKETAIVLTVTDAAAWNAYVADIQESLNAAPAVADAVGTPEEEVEAEELLLKPVAATTDIDPLLAKVADTLVQSTWGTVGASRAFGETIASRGRHATLLDDGKGAAWLSVMGGSSRISSAEGHNGADFTLSGAAFGMEGRVSEKSTLGVAIGNSWGKVSTFSAFPVDQDSMHVGIYGNHTLTKSLTLSWMATHTRTESEATVLGAPYSWSQDALQLDARLTWGKSISEKTAVSAFAGLQYLTTDSGECAGLKTGSLQNLRAELGVGASHKCSDSTLVFGELSFIGDMVRNNPTAAIGDDRTHGTNPGRVGLNLSVGAQHQLSEDWSVNASYSLELMENSTSHSLNVGASYSF